MFKNMAEKQGHDGGTKAPVELLYEMLLAGNAYLEHQTDGNLAEADAIANLVKVAERMPLPTGQSSLTMQDIIAAATGVTGIVENTPHTDEGRIVPEVQNEVLSSVVAQQFLNCYMEKTFGWVFDFTPRPDEQLISLSQKGINRDEQTPN